MALLVGVASGCLCHYLTRPQPLIEIGFRGTGKTNFVHEDEWTVSPPNVRPHNEQWLVVERIDDDWKRNWNPIYYFVDYRSHRSVEWATGTTSRAVRTIGFDDIGFRPDGLFVAITVPDSEGDDNVCEVCSFDPTSGNTDRFQFECWDTNLSQPFRRVLISADRTTLAVLTVEANQVLKVDIRDTTSGRVRNSFRVEDRTNCTYSDLATALSPTGHKLALGAGWNVANRVADSAVIDTSTGKVLTRFDNSLFSAPPTYDGPIENGYPKISIDWGVVGIAFSPDGHDLIVDVGRKCFTKHSIRWIDGWMETCCIDLETQKLVERNWWQLSDLEAAESPDIISSDGAHIVWTRDTDDSIKISTFEGATLRHWKKFNPDDVAFPGYGRVVPGAHGMAFVAENLEAHEPGVFAPLRSFLQRYSLPDPFSNRANRASWYDWETDELTHFAVGRPDDRVDCEQIATASGRVSCLFNSDGPNTRLEVWPIPPQRIPIWLPWCIGIVVFFLARSFLQRLLNRASAS